ncbi:MAG: family 1 glycosylhydrolase, partial [Clostridia bacterium]|nr:family 1 glycosylhydrolase [Clostridia bacterium]
DVADGIKGGHTCHEGCRHYEKWEEDCELLKELGVNTYSFFVSLPRVVPKKGVVNKEGLEFYIRLVDRLSEYGIKPMVTLYHWDLPLWANEYGGWESEEIIDDFAFFTEVVVKALSQKVGYWVPINEPQCFVNGGYIDGAHAPFYKHGNKLADITKTVLRAFKKSCEIIRKNAVKKPLIGIAMASGAYIPEDDSLYTMQKAYEKTFNYSFGKRNNAWWCDLLIKGSPVEYEGNKITAEESVSLRTDIDFLGLNIYNPYNDYEEGKKGDKVKNYLGLSHDGRCLYYAVKFFSTRYGLPLMITENGTCLDDKLSGGGIDDTVRTDYINDYLANLKKAIDEGYKVIGYKYWSFMDNFEWTFGYYPRFGLVYIDYNTYERIPKKSFYFYKEVIKQSGDNVYGIEEDPAKN